MSKLTLLVSRLVAELQKRDTAPSQTGPTEATVIKSVRAEVFRLESGLYLRGLSAVEG